jgi:acetyl-CoA carboxylase carboxyl transferase subunit alpha
MRAEQGSEPGPAGRLQGLGEALRLRERYARLQELQRQLRGVGVSTEMERLRRQIEEIEREPTADEVWTAVELARHRERPYTLDYVERLFEDFIELRGDRTDQDDQAIVAGLGRFDGRTVALVGHQKGRDIHENVRRRFGMASPEGYRKAIRVMEVAGRHGFPLVSLVDTPGAYPGVQAEQHGQAGWIARSQLAMAQLASPSVACVIGEGGSGGAVALAVADRVLMQENAIYSVISPEGCAAILWRDGGQKMKAAAALKPDAKHCLDLGVVDGIVPEPPGGAHTEHDEAARLLGDCLRAALGEIAELDPVERRSLRRAKFRRMGVFAG